MIVARRPVAFALHYLLLSIVPVLTALLAITSPSASQLIGDRSVFANAQDCLFSPLWDRVTADHDDSAAVLVVLRAWLQPSANQHARPDRVCSLRRTLRASSLLTDVNTVNSVQPIFVQPHQNRVAWCSTRSDRELAPVQSLVLRL